MGAMVTAGLVVGAATYLSFEKPTTDFLKRLIKRPSPLLGSSIANYSTVPPSIVASAKAKGIN
jgi:hypothetical protein